jgi:hypothetical protein
LPHIVSTRSARERLSWPRQARGTALGNRGIHGVKGAFRGADKQTENQRGHRGHHAGPQLDGVLRFLGEMMVWQPVLQPSAQKETGDQASID